MFFVLVCIAAKMIADRSGSKAGPWYSIVPPLTAIVMAFLTKRVLVSLGAAIVLGGLLSTVPQSPVDITAWLAGAKATVSFFTDTVTTVDNLKILSFIPPIFVMVELIIASGGFVGVLLILLRWVKSKRTAQLSTAIMGLICFIDDYANALIVGSMMQPITDRFRISREKLAFIVDATSAPVSGIAVVSTWITFEVGLFSQISDKLALGKGGYAIFFDALAFRFYCIFMIFFVLAQAIFGRDFGPMKTAEQGADNNSRKNLDNSTDNDCSIRQTLMKEHKGKAVNALVPITGLVLFHLISLWFDGGGPGKLKTLSLLTHFTYWRDVISAATHGHIILLKAAIFGLTLALILGLLTKSLSRRAILNSVKSGLKRCVLPSLVLIFAWSLKNCSDNLKTPEFLASILAGRIPPWLFPPVLFFVASITSFATGTSWGTMAILIPTAIPIAHAIDGNVYGLTTMISFGAILDGAIFGDHCSPISDTTIISSTASNCDLIKHVRTQLPYSLFVAGVALAFAYLPCSLGLSSAVGMILGIGAITTTLFVLSRFRNKTAS